MCDEKAQLQWSMHILLYFIAIYVKFVMFSCSDFHSDFTIRSGVVDMVEKNTELVDIAWIDEKLRLDEGRRRPWGGQPRPPEKRRWRARLEREGPNGSCFLFMGEFFTPATTEWTFCPMRNYGRGEKRSQIKGHFATPSKGLSTTFENTYVHQSCASEMYIWSL